MKRVWYIKVEDTPEGPYSIEELRWDPRLTLNTLAWKEGMPHWLPIKQIPELADIIQKKDEEGEDVEAEGGEGVLTLAPEPQFPTYLLVAVALILALLFYFYMIL